MTGSTVTSHQAMSPSEMHQTLPSRVYLDPNIFDRELELIFARTWQYVGHVEKLPKPGDYFVDVYEGKDAIGVDFEGDWDCDQVPDDAPDGQPVDGYVDVDLI